MDANKTDISKSENSKSETKLSEKEELLLLKYSDNECGVFQRFIARRLISNNSQAADFVNSLQLLSNEFAVSRQNKTESNIDLWSKISNRIDQEEKAEFYLGARAIDSANPKNLRKESYGFFDWSGINLGLSAGVVAAGLALFFIYGITPSLDNPFSDNLNSSQQQTLSNANIRNVSTNSIYTAPKIDWLKSHAKVRMIRDSNFASAVTDNTRRRLPVIWVSRSLPEDIDSPNIDLFDAGNETNSDTPIILNERAPNAVSVLNTSRANSKQK